MILWLQMGVLADEYLLPCTSGVIGLIEKYLLPYAIYYILHGETQK